MFYKQRIYNLNIKIARQESLISHLEAADANCKEFYYMNQLIRAHPDLVEMKEKLKVLEYKYENTFFRM